MMCTAAAVTHMRKQGSGGGIINVTSVAARHGGGAGASLYAGSKGFVSTMKRGLAKELVKGHIRVNAMAPGVITPLPRTFLHTTNAGGLQSHYSHESAGDSPGVRRVFCTWPPSKCQAM